MDVLVTNEGASLRSVLFILHSLLTGNLPHVIRFIESCISIVCDLMSSLCNPAMNAMILNQNVQAKGVQPKHVFHSAWTKSSNGRMCSRGAFTALVPMTKPLSGR